MATPETQDDLRPEYDLASLRLRRTSPKHNTHPRLTVALDDDVAAIFTTPEAVNHALRALIAAIPPNASPPNPPQPRPHRCPHNGA